MISILFWNVGRRSVGNRVARLAHRHAADWLILAEVNDDPAEVLLQLNEGNAASPFRFAAGVSEAVRIFVRFSSEYVEPVRESARYSIRAVRMPARQEILLVATHLPSLLHMSRESQMGEFFELSRAIREAETARGHQRTMVVGDLNANPFSDPVVSAAGMNAVMTRIVAKRDARTVQGRQYPFFYNPMWSCLGERDGTPPGSYYYDSGEDVQHFWHTFDQVLIRPSLMDAFDDSTLRILDSDGHESLLSATGKPDRKGASDHLPIHFCLKV